MKKQILLFVVGVITAYIGYYATLPVPEGIPINPYLLRALTAILDIMKVVFPLLPTSIRDIIDKPPIINTNPGLNVTETRLDGIPAIMYEPVEVRPQETLLPAVIFLHGGGWMLGSIYHSQAAATNIAVSLNLSAVVISLGYRLAPKHKFPAAIDDVTTGIVWLLRHGEELGIDKERIIVIGESAGGNLAAAVSQRLTFDVQYNDLPKLRAQVLVYPVLQMFDLRTPSYQQNGRYRTLIISPHWMAQFFSNYVTGDESLVPALVNNEHIAPYARASTSPYSKFVSHEFIPEEFKKENYSPIDINLGNEQIYNEIKDIVLNPDFAPLMRPTLEGLPEAYIVTCQFDLLRDDGILYAKRLEEQHVKTTLRYYKTGYHSEFSVYLSQPLYENSTTGNDLVDDTLKFLADVTLR